MPISRVDYESAPAETVDLAGVSAAAQALANATVPAPPPPPVRPAMDIPAEAGPEKKNLPPPCRAFSAETAATVAGGGNDAPPTENYPTDQPPAEPQPIIPHSQTTLQEENENPGDPEWPGSGGGYKNRVDAVRGQLNNQNPGGEELLEQAVSLLEAVARHPAMADYAGLKQRLDNVEQTLNSSANVR
jgi:hypothetical protein